MSLFHDKKWTGEFQDPDVERQFWIETWFSWSKVTRYVCLLLSSLMLLIIIPRIDYVELGFGPEFLKMLAFRALSLPVLGAAIYLSFSSRPRVLGLHLSVSLTSLAVFISISAATVIFGSNAQQFILNFIFVVFLNFAVLPNRFSCRALVGAASVVSLSGAALYVSPAFTSDVFFPIGVAIVANVLGAISGVWWGARQREEYLLRKSSDLAQAQIEKRLENSEAKFQAIFDQLQDLFYRSNAKGEFVVVSPSVHEILGYLPEEILGHKLTEYFVDPSVREPLIAELTKQGGRARDYEIEYRKKDGKHVWLSTNVKLIFDKDGNLAGTEGSSRDVTELRAMREELLAYKSDLEGLVEEKTNELEISEYRFGQLITNTQEGYWFVTPDNVIAEVNQALCDLLGRDLQDVLGKSIFDFVDDTNRAVFEHQLAQQGLGVVGRYEVALLRSDGVNITCLNNPTAIFDKRGKQTGSINLWTDISKLKEANLQLERAKLDAEVANYAKSSFLANMSHEIRTPMNGIVGMAEILMQSDLDTDQSRQTQTILNSSHSLMRIIDDILDMSKIEAGKLDLEFTEMSLKGAIEKAAVAMALASDDNNVRLHLNIDQTTPDHIAFDVIRLRQVVDNLLSNAIKFSQRPDGETKGQVMLSLSNPEPDSFQIVVKDDGIGIAEDTLKNLFLPFSQAEASTTRRFGGSGLGLSITKNLVELLGGTIKVESAEGEGTTFTTVFPCKPLDTDDDGLIPWGFPIFAMFDAELNSSVLSANQNRAEVSYLKLKHTEDALIEAVQASVGPVLVVLGLGTMADNNVVCAKLQDPDGRVRFMCQTYDRSDKLGRVSRDCYVISRFPSLPSELIKGAKALMGPTDADRDPSDCETVTATTEKTDVPKARILLVEDNEINQEVIATQVKLLGYDVDVAVNGTDGMEKWKSGDYNLILSDCHMPEMDGFEMTASIRQAENDNRIPIIAITANALQGEAERCIAADMDDYLSKPVEMQRLKATLSKWLNPVA